MSQTLWFFGIKSFARVWLIRGTWDGPVARTDPLHWAQCGSWTSRDKSPQVIDDKGHSSLAFNCFFYCLCWGKTTPMALTHLHLLLPASPLKGSQDFGWRGVSAGDFVRECTETSFSNHQLNCSMIFRGSNCSVCLPISPFPNNFLAHWSGPIKFENEAETPERLFPPVSMGTGNQWRKNTLHKGYSFSSRCSEIQTNFGRFCSSQTSLPCVSLPALLVRHSLAALC